MNLVAVVVGGGLGAGARYLLQGWIHGLVGAPWGTLGVNILGSAVLGALSVARPGSAQAWLFCTTGLLGGFTTYATFNQELLDFAARGDAWRGFAYAGGTLGACLLGAAGGGWLARALTA